MLLMVKKVLEEEICHSIYRYAKANDTYKKDCDKTKIIIPLILGCK